MQEVSQADGTIFDDLLSNQGDRRESFAYLVDKTGSAWHRVPQKRIDFIPVHVADNQYLKVLHVHIENSRRGKAERFEDAIRRGLVRTGWK